MDRLTILRGVGEEYNGAISKGWVDIHPEYQHGENSHQFKKDLMQTVSAYEETGLTPEQILELKKTNVTSLSDKIIMAANMNNIPKKAIIALNHYVDADQVCEKILQLNILEIVEMLKMGYVLTPPPDRSESLSDAVKYLESFSTNKYSFNLYNNENWDNELFETREDAIEAGREALTEENTVNSQIARSLGHGFDGYLTHFYIGECILASVPSVDIEDILERLSEAAFEDGGEYAEDWLDNVSKSAQDDLCSKLNDVVKQWVNDNSLNPTWYGIENVERVEINNESEAK